MPAGLLRPREGRSNQFLRWFCLHILPSRFVKIRHYGLLAKRNRDVRVERARQLLDEPPPETQPATAPEQPPAKTQDKPQLACPHCGSARMCFIADIRPFRTTRFPTRALDSS